MAKYYGSTVKRGKYQTGRSIKAKDKRRRARYPGKRISKRRRVYYEYRRNRSDMHPSLRL